MKKQPSAQRMMTETVLELGTETRTEIDSEGDRMRRAGSGRWDCGRESTGIVPRGWTDRRN